MLFSNKQVNFVHLSVVCFSALILIDPCVGYAETSVVEFNHFKTGFPLTGAHVQLKCESCHVNENFESTPTK